MRIIAFLTDPVAVRAILAHLGEATAPAVVCGLTPYNLGGPDEYIMLDDLDAVAYMHTLTAFDFLATE